MDRRNVRRGRELDGELRMENGEWRMENGESYQLSAASYQLLAKLQILDR